MSTTALIVIILIILLLGGGGYGYRAGWGGAPVGGIGLVILILIILLRAGRRVTRFDAASSRTPSATVADSVPPASSDTRQKAPSPAAPPARTFRQESRGARHLASAKGQRFRVEFDTRGADRAFCVLRLRSRMPIYQRPRAGQPNAVRRPPPRVQ